MTIAKLLLPVLSLCMLAVEMPASVVAIYSFDGQNGNDVSGNNNHATGSVAYSTATPFGDGYAYSVNGDKLTASHVNGSSFDTINTSLSVSFWINATTTDNANWFRVIRKGAGSTSSNNWIINRYNATADTNIRIDSGDSGSGYNQNLAYTSSGGSVLDGSWHLVTYVLNYTSGTTGTILEYLDGNLVSPNTGNSFIFGNGLNNPHALEIGVSSGNWTGMLDDLGIWSNALTTGEARSIYTLADNNTFAYDLELVTQLHSLHAQGAGGGPLTLGSYTWEYVDGLSGQNVGDLYLNGDNQWVLKLTDSTGLLATPEPGRALLLGGGLALVFLRRRR